MARKKIAVIGLGGFGERLAKYLFQEGHEVLVVDNNKDRIEEIKDHVTAVACLDATEESTLKSTGIGQMEIAVIALANDFETSIVIADILKKVGIASIHARYATELHKRIFDMMGIKDTFNPEETAAKAMAEILGYSQMKSAFIVSEDYSVSEVILPIRYANKTIAELELIEKYQISIVTIKRIEKEIEKKRASDKKKEQILGIVEGGTILLAGDTLVIFGSQKDINRFLEV